MGVPVKTDMETVVLGTNPVGLPIYFDKNAYEADGIVLVNRVKPHTDFHSTHESGVLKMMVIGLGKRDGASQVHKLGVRGLREVLPAVGRFLVKNTRFALGLAIVENAEDRPAEIAAHRARDDLRSRAGPARAGPKLDGPACRSTRSTSWSWASSARTTRVPGMDPNVIGRLLIETQPDFDRPVITRLVVLDVSDESHGNIVGVGFADLTTERLVSKLDPESFRINVITSCCLERARIPITLATDREVIETAIETCWRIDPSQARVVVIPNTLELKSLWVSAPLEDEVRRTSAPSRETDYLPMPFPDDGSLDQDRLFPDSIRGRRRT